MTTTTTAKVTLEHRGAVRVVTLRDPDRRNAIDDAMRRDLHDAFERVRTDEEARALVVAGEGEAFCAGADLPALFGDPERSVADTRRELQRVYESFLVLRRVQVPTIAAVSGHAIGAGLNLALACDLRVVGPGTRLGATFTRIGLHPGGGCTAFLVEALGPQRALALLLDGGVVDGPEAEGLGLALRCVDDPVGEALVLAERYAALEPGLVRDVKRTVATAARDGFDAALELESWAQAASATLPGVQEHVARFRR